MDAIDKTKAFMLIEAKNQPTEEVFALPANGRLLVRRDQTQQPITAGPADTTLKVSRLRIYLHMSCSPVTLRQM